VIISVTKCAIKRAISLAKSVQYQWLYQWLSVQWKACNVSGCRRAISDTTSVQCNVNAQYLNGPGEGGGSKSQESCRSSRRCRSSSHSACSPGFEPAWPVTNITNYTQWCNKTGPQQHYRVVQKTVPGHCKSMDMQIISQGGVAIHLRCDGICKNHFIVN